MIGAVSLLGPPEGPSVETRGVDAVTTAPPPCRTQGPGPGDGDGRGGGDERPEADDGRTSSLCCERDYCLRDPVWGPGRTDLKTPLDLYPEPRDGKERKDTTLTPTRFLSTFVVVVCGRPLPRTQSRRASGVGDRPSDLRIRIFTVVPEPRQDRGVPTLRPDQARVDRGGRGGVIGDRTERPVVWPRPGNESRRRRRHFTSGHGQKGPTPETSGGMCTGVIP